MMVRTIKLWLFLYSLFMIQVQGSDLLRISVSENNGLDRPLEYIEFSFQMDLEGLSEDELKFIVTRDGGKAAIPCQVSFTPGKDSNAIKLIRVVFPVTIKANGSDQYYLKSVKKVKTPTSKLKLSGEGLGLIIENEFYRVDLTKDAAVEPQSHDSGQIREIFIKLGLNQLVANVENRVHWSPSFDRPEIEWYKTMAHWNFPKFYELTKGPYQIRTIRQDVAPDFPEILLTGTYDFYDGLPYFRFYSGMEMRQDVWIELLRNDEMAMDSIFTHLAFQRPGGEIVDIPFSNMYPLLKDYPIENESPWICFYNESEGFAIGSIRVMYDNTDIFGDESIVYDPHTQIGEWEGSRYWNRRIIHDHLTFVPQGSRYQEECAYLVFKIDKDDPLSSIKHSADRIRNPLKIDIEYLK